MTEQETWDMFAAAAISAGGDYLDARDCAEGAANVADEMAKIRAFRITETAAQDFISGMCDDSEHVDFRPLIADLDQALARQAAAAALSPDPE